VLALRGWDALATSSDTSGPVSSRTGKIRTWSVLQGSGSRSDRSKPDPLASSNERLVSPDPTPNSIQVVEVEYSCQTIKAGRLARD
jgi:hypothetical protein